MAQTTHASFLHAVTGKELCFNTVEGQCKDLNTTTGSSYFICNENQIQKRIRRNPGKLAHRGHYFIFNKFRSTV